MSGRNVGQSGARPPVSMRCQPWPWRRRLTSRHHASWNVRLGLLLEEGAELQGAGRERIHYLVIRYCP
jgi:hypothetical protein